MPAKKTQKPIKGILDAKSIYKVRWFKYPIDVVNYENGLQHKGLLEVKDRMTCGNCKRFETNDHITQHATGPKPIPNMQGLF